MTALIGASVPHNVEQESVREASYTTPLLLQNAASRQSVVLGGLYAAICLPRVPLNVTSPLTQLHTFTVQPANAFHQSSDVPTACAVAAGITRHKDGNGMKAPPAQMASVHVAYCVCFARLGSTAAMHIGRIAGARLHRY